MIPNEFAKNLLHELAPDEAELVGSAFIDSIVIGQIQFEKPNLSQNLDLSYSLEVLANLMTVITGVWVLYEAWKKREPSKPSANDLAQKAYQEMKIPNSIGQSVVIEICIRVLARVEVDSEANS